jgi:hypothetical protein
MTWMQTDGCGVKKTTVLNDGRAGPGMVKRVTVSRYRMAGGGVITDAVITHVPRRWWERAASGLLAGLVFGYTFGQLVAYGVLF